MVCNSKWKKSPNLLSNIDLKYILIFGIVLLLIGFGFQTPVFSQENVLCPQRYETENRTIPLASQQISNSSTISKAICTYSKQSTSETTFVISWSPLGNVYGDWCAEKLMIQNGMGEYQSKTHYAKISASGILPSEFNYAQDFMRLLFIMVRDDSKPCFEPIQSIQIEKPTENTPDPKNTKKNITSSMGSNQLVQTTTAENFPNAHIQFVVQIMIIIVVIGIGYMIFRRYR